MTVQGHDEFKLWFGMAIAGLAVAIIVWLLIFWSIAMYRKKKGDDDTPPKQTREHLPLEVIYTTIPIIIVGVIFYFTVVTENEIDAVPPAAETVHVLAFRWGWQFTYANGDNVPQHVVIRTAAEPKLLAGNPKSSQYPQLVLPLGERTKIVLTSNDVVHSFYVPQFNFDRMALPGFTNRFEFTPTRIGVYDAPVQHVLRPLSLRDVVQRARRVEGRLRELDQSRADDASRGRNGVMTLVAERPQVATPEPHEPEHGPIGDHEVDHLDRSQGDRKELPHHLVPLLFDGGLVRDDHAHATHLS